MGSSYFVITRMITDRIGLHSVLLPLFIVTTLKVTLERKIHILYCWVTSKDHFADYSILALYGLASLLEAK